MTAVYFSVGIPTGFQSVCVYVMQKDANSCDGEGGTDGKWGGKGWPAICAEWKEGRRRHEYLPSGKTEAGNLGADTATWLFRSE